MHQSWCSCVQFSISKWTDTCTDAGKASQTSIHGLISQLAANSTYSCCCPANDVFLTMVFQALGVLTTTPNGNTDVVAVLYSKVFKASYCVHEKLFNTAGKVLIVFCGPQVWWPKWRCRGPSLSDVIICITSASTTALRRGTRTSLSICHLASGMDLLTFYESVSRRGCFNNRTQTAQCELSKWFTKDQ